MTATDDKRLAQAPSGQASAGVAVRRLTPAHADAYQALRLRSLREYPQAFTSSAKEETQRHPQWAQQRLRADPMAPHDLFFGAFIGEVLVGMVGLSGRYRAKERHNATLVGMFVVHEAANQGIGMALLQALLAHARQLPELEQIDLTVTEGNVQAQALYARCGFVVWGVMPRAIKVSEQYFAKVHMLLRLRR